MQPPFKSSTPKSCALWKQVGVFFPLSKDFTKPSEMCILCATSFCCVTPTAQLPGQHMLVLALLACLLLPQAASFYGSSFLQGKQALAPPQGSLLPSTQRSGPILTVTMLPTHQDKNILLNCYY